MRIGSYQVLLELARGGMGKVYLARTVGPGGVERLVAIKRAHQHLLARSRAVADRFLDEARIAAHVHHSNVIGVHQAGSDADGYYLVLDYVEGESLEGLIEAAQARGARVPPQIVLAIVCDALAGLHAAHEATDGHGRALGILHRDVSTQNLLVGRDGVTRLTDFGIAKSALSLVVTDEIYVQGKLAYMSPEYLQRKPVDRTLDVYAMGMTLWIALAGDVPWPDAEEAQILRSILVEGIPPLSTSAGEVGPEIAAVVDRACALHPQRRFETARAMLDALENASKSIGGLARHVEVAEFVEGLVGKDFAARRDVIKSCREELEVATTPSAPEGVPSAPAPREPSSRHERADGWVPDEPRVSTDALRRTWKERKPWRAILYAAVVAVVVVVGAAVARRGSSHGAAPAADVPVVSAPPTSAATSTAVGAATSTAAGAATSTALGGSMPSSSSASASAGVQVVPAETAHVAPAVPKAHSSSSPRARARQRPGNGTDLPPEPPGVAPFSTANPYR